MKSSSRAAVAHPALTLALLLVGTFMTNLDVAIVNVAGPSIQGDLHMSGASLQLVISSFTIALAALQVTGARLGDDFGHRRIFLAAITIFTAASLACGLAWSPGVLIAARIAQGVGAAGISTQVITMIQLMFTGASRARALAIYAVSISLAAVVGQIGGGALTSANIAGSGWRPVFLINVPIGVALVVIAPRVVPATRGAVRRRQDPVGVLLFLAAAVLLTLPLILGREVHWAAWTWVSLAASVPAGWALFRHLSRVEAAGGDPLFKVSLFRLPGVRNGLMALFALMAGYGGFLLTLALLLQQHHHYSPVASGLTFGPFAGGFAVAAIAVSRLRPALMRRAQVTGLLMLAGADVGVALITRTGQWPAGIGLALLAVAGAGLGAGFSPAMGRVVAQVPAESAHHASGLVTTTITVSYAVGVATLGSYYLAGQATNPGAAFAATAVAVAVLAVAAAFLLSRLGGVPPSAGPDPAAMPGRVPERAIQEP